MDGYEVSNSLSGTTVHGDVIQGGNVTVNVGPKDRIPHQVRPARPTFVNRERELAALVAAIGRVEERKPRIVAFTGLGGVGKTELIAHFVSQYGDLFPGGDLYADLAAYRHLGGVDLSEVLAGFLREFGVADVPGSMSERVARFRTITAVRRVLVFLDNVEHAAEVRGLLPAGGLVVVAGRRRLPGLSLDGAEVLQLDPLSSAAGVKLVRCWLGPGRGTDQEVAELVGFCDGLPLALNAVGYQLLDGELEIDQALAELSDPARRLVSLDNEEGGIDRMLDPVVRRLSPHAEALYHLVGVNPGPFVSAELAEASGIDRAPDGLRELRSAHLLDDVVDDGPGRRYRAHDLVRLHAHGCARELPERLELLARIVGYFRGRAALADALVLGERFRLQEQSGAGLPGFADKKSALGWLRAERANLRETVRAAAEQGWHGEVWRLCESLWALYHSDKNYGDWIGTHRLGVESAQWDNRPDAVIRMRNQLARAHYELKEFPLAAEQVAMASELLPLVDEPRLSGVLYETDGLLCLADGRPERAVELFTLARAANEGDPHGVVVQSYNIAQALIAAGRAAEAIGVLDEAVVIAERTDDEPMLMRLPLVRARAYRDLGDTEAAVRCAEECVRRAAELGHLAKEREAHRLLVSLAGELGDATLAARSRAWLGEPES
ncbi:regulator [Kitasatospora sp. NPDC058162]|uniref:regulator n=1 Tax=Kitasatospora sp. NPDC058162 TaxID=3346362 RepID=UPI0036D7C49B